MTNLCFIQVSNSHAIRWNICGKEIQCQVIATEPDRPCVKINCNTVIQIDSEMHAKPFSSEEQKDIYLTSLADMIRKFFLY